MAVWLVVWSGKLNDGVWNGALKENGAVLWVRCVLFEFAEDNL